MRCRSLRLLAFPFCLVLAASAQNSPVLGGCAGPALGSFGAYSVTAFGSGFAPGDTLQWNRSTVTTAFASSTQLNAAIPAGMVMPADSHLLTESSSGVLSNCVLVAIQPPPAIASVAPGQVDAGGQSFAATLFGTGFVAGSQVLAEGQPLSTAFIGPGQLNFSIPAASLASSGKYVLAVANPSGAVSNALVFYIQPVLASISPTLGVAGSSGLTITATGTGFVPGDILVLNRAGVFQTLPTTYLGPTGLSALVPATALQSAGQAMIFVSDGDLSSGIASRSLAFRVGNAPMIGALSANTRVAGGSDFTLSISGDGFLPGAAVQWNAAGSTTPLSTTFNGAVQLTAAVPAQMTAAPGAATITVANPAGAVSNAMSFTVTPPGLAISNLAPGSAVAGGPAFALIVSGSGFASGATVLWNGKALPTTVAGDSQATAAVSAALIASSGTAAIAVTTSAGVSNPLAFPIAPPIPVVSTNGIVNALSLASFHRAGIAHFHLGDQSGARRRHPRSARARRQFHRRHFRDHQWFRRAAPLCQPHPHQCAVALRGRPRGRRPSGGGGRWRQERPGPVPGNRHRSRCLVPLNQLLTQPRFSRELCRWHAERARSPGRAGPIRHPVPDRSRGLCTPLSTGYPAPPAPFLYPTADVQASIGGAAAQVPFAGLVPGWVGILQMNLLVPNAPSGEQPLEIAIGGVSANPTTLSIQSP